MIKLNRNLKFLSVAFLMVPCSNQKENRSLQQISSKPNVIIILTDQWRAQAFGFRGDPNIITPNIDKMASEGVVFHNAISGMPICTPARASILTGQRPLTHGLFMNDIPLDTTITTLGEVIATADYETAYIGKLHIDGHGRHSFTPPGKRRRGFKYWKAIECVHAYNSSKYYADTPEVLTWDGYDVIAQTKDACQYIKDNSNKKNPFFLFLSWGPPHNPYETAPQEYKDLYSADKIQLRPNVPEEMKESVRKDIVGYYAHCTAMDDMLGELRKVLEDQGIKENTIILFLADHGDLLGSHGFYQKQRPYEESVKIPMIFYIPEKLGGQKRDLSAMINVEDVMPTILGLLSLEIPESVEGFDYSKHILGGPNLGDTVSIVTCVQPFARFNVRNGGKEFRGLCSPNYTYVRDLNGPWLFFDNKNDPYQMNNLVGNKDYEELEKAFDNLLDKKLKETGDEFLPGMEYVKRWGYVLDEKGLYKGSVKLEN